MKFDFAIGNPPYQEESKGDNKNLAMPVYHKFMDAASEVANTVELIHPARFLFGVGRTPNEFNERKLNDEHFKILHYEHDASKIFSNTEIKGGVVISIQDKNKDYGKIEVFIDSDSLRGIFEKVWKKCSSESIFNMVSPRLMFHYSKKYFDDNPELDISSGPLHSVQSDAFDKCNKVFHKKMQDETNYAFIGKSKESNERVWRYINQEYIEENDYINKWKVLMPRSNGSGEFGETIASPIVCKPKEGGTDTFIFIGPVNTELEAKAIFKYIKSKFCRAMLGVLKTTAGNTRPVWKYVPMQDFTNKADIDWNTTIANIDKQLYKKYGLSDEEIKFIETNVKEMK